MTEPQQPAPEPIPEAPAKPPEGAEPEPKVFDADYVANLRKEAAKYRTEAKTGAEAIKRLAEIENANKTELQKIQDRAEAAEKRAADLEAAEQKRIADAEAAQQIAEWKTKIAGEPDFVGVPASALRGSTEKELREHAKELKALIPERKGGGYVPAEGRAVGAGGSDPRQQFAEILRNA